MTAPKLDGAIASPTADDRASDRETFRWIAAIAVAFLVVDLLSVFTEIKRFNLELLRSEYAIYEISSLVVALSLLPFIARATSAATPGQHRWTRLLAVHSAGALVFSLIHVAGMVALRKAAFSALYGKPYIFTDNLVRELIYEFRKDALFYAIAVLLFTTGRLLSQQARELAAARDDAKTTRRLTLKCGGRTVMVDADAVRWAKSASNYVEVAAHGKTHLARSTLAAIEQQLREAGANAARVHRSYVVNADFVREVRPTGEGDTMIEMTDGSVIPGSRRFRDRLPVGQPAPQDAG